MNLKEKYADLIVRSGLNVQKDQIVVVRANVEMNEFVRLIFSSRNSINSRISWLRLKKEKLNRVKTNSLKNESVWTLNFLTLVLLLN